MSTFKKATSGSCNRRRVGERSAGGWFGAMLLSAFSSRGITFALCWAALLIHRPLWAAGAWDRNGFDTDDLEALERHHPELSAVFLRGEAALRAGSVRAAADAFQQVTRGAPENALASRRYCQALTELGSRQEALAACQASLQQKATSPGFRALVGALMSAAPTPEELVLANELAAAAKRRMNDQPWGLAAIGDIAERTGDEAMLEATVQELERIAPGHYETLRARHALDSFKLPRWVWGVWVALGLLAIATLGHALRAALRQGRSRATAVAGSLLAVACMLGVATAHAQSAAPAEAPPPGTLSQWPVNDADPKKSLPTPEQRDKNPLEFGYHMMDLADKADIARRKGDFRSVGKYYEAMATAVPDRSIGYRKSCEGYEQAGDADKALQMCRGALGAEGVELGDYQHFAKLVFAKQGALSATEIEDLSQIATHLKAEQGGMGAGLAIQCQLAERTDDLKQLEDCATTVARETPNDPKLIVYQWGIAMKHEDYRRAQELIDVARRKALHPAGIELMARATQEQSAFSRRLIRAIERNALGLSVCVAVLSAAALAVALRRRFKLHLA